MVLAMPRPIRLPNSKHPYARKVVPKELRGILGRTEFKRPLRAETETEVKRLHALALAEWEGLIAGARRRLTSPAQAMTARDIAAVGGDYYRAEVARYQDDPGSADAWDNTRSALTDRIPQDWDGEGDPSRLYEPSQADLAEAEALWGARGVVADADTLRRTAQAVWSAKFRAYATLQARAEGDWTTDAYAARYPPPAPQAAPGDPQAPVAGKAPPGTAAAPLSFASLIEQRALEERPPLKTREKWVGTFKMLAACIGHDDARRVTSADALKWKQARQAAGKAPKTVGDGIATCRAAMNWGIRNGLLPKENPFAGLAPRIPAGGLPARSPFTDSQAATLLAAARQERGWKRWLPWVLAFTGARIEEVAELRRCDIRREEGVWIIDIKPSDTRPGKTAHAQRMIPVHPALEAEGFVTYAQAGPADAPLWADISVSARYNSRGSVASKAHSRWVRACGIEDPRIAPAHSWRHRMEDALRRVRATPEVADAIMGHDNPRNAGAQYGRGLRQMPDELMKDLARIPSPLAEDQGIAVEGEKTAQPQTEAQA